MTMAKTKDTNDSDGVTALIKQLNPAFAKLVEHVRKIILTTDNEIGEQVKWNSPSFFYTGDMKPFDLKEYKRDMVVMHLRKEVVLLIFPTGATIKNTTGFLEGDYKDGRRMVTIADMADAKKKTKDLQKVIKQWLKLVEK